MKNNPTRSFEEISGKLAECHSIGDIEEYVCSMAARRESTRRIIVDFLQYLSRKTGKNFSTILSDKRFYDYPFERQLEIAKYLQEPRTAQG